jgi:hypothetical protein
MSTINHHLFNRKEKSMKKTKIQKLSGLQLLAVTMLFFIGVAVL